MFKFTLEVIEIDSIKPRQSGNSKIDGQDVKWGHAVKFKVRKIDMIPDEHFGEKEQEQTLEIEIACDSLTETVALNTHLKKLKADKKPFTINTTIPSGSGGQYSCKATLKGADFMMATKK